MQCGSPSVQLTHCPCRQRLAGACNLGRRRTGPLCKFAHGGPSSAPRRSTMESTDVVSRLRVRCWTRQCGVEIGPTAARTSGTASHLLPGAPDASATREVCDRAEAHPRSTDMWVRRLQTIAVYSGAGVNDRPDVVIRCPQGHLAHPTVDPSTFLPALDNQTAQFFCAECGQHWPVPSDLYDAFRAWLEDAW